MLDSCQADDPTTVAKGHSLSAVVVAAAVSVAAAVRFLDHLAPPTTPALDDPADAVVLLAGTAVVILGSWWLANVATWLAALRRGSRVHRFTLPGTRRLAQLLLAASLSGACVAEPVGGPTMVLIEDRSEQADATGDELPVTSSTRQTTTPHDPASEPTATPDPSTEAEATTTASEPPDNIRFDEMTTDPPAAEGEIDPSIDLAPSIPAHQVIVIEGDNLWSLSAEALERHGAADPTVALVAEYWRLVIASNQVRSGDPDLIVPGETIDLPAHTFAS